ncbi:AmmeMemoRadiSam system protein A [Petroclostridium sp. X23]|uniref:AmmeMemoRadiSam system protein A n=1 Tax=Petroclostridium sp. X23 TaxID=3045146 RepID=UPI0024AD4BF7|nr:AmmeMemoRadiSam system protein A [Petroclostridium sp. X23]WHH59329.1 AmmeMemoRadiSam system protein A [Petroclostridium sp. X23]
MGKISAFYTMPHPPIIIPEVGRGEEGKIKETSDACYQVAEEVAMTQPDTIIIVTPHGPLFSDAVALSCGDRIKGDFGKFSASQVVFNVDINIPLAEKIIAYAEKENIFTAEITEDTAEKYGIKYELDHGTMVPLYFINKKFSDYNIIHITYGMLPKLQLYKFGMCIKKAVDDSQINAVFIASGDLSHRLSNDGPYEYSPYGEKFDKEMIALLKNGDVSGIFNMDCTTVENAGECGLRSYYIMAGAMNGYEIKGDLLAYQGTFGVGYAVMRFSTKVSDQDTYTQLIQEREKRFTQKIKNEDPYVKLARESLTHYLIKGEYMQIPAYVTDEMAKSRTGVFVSIKKEGQLRGCIGTILPTTENVAKEIIRNAVEAGQHDPRFPAVDEGELGSLDFSVDVLTAPQKASKEELNPKKYGVIVKSGHKSGLLLPDLEGVDTVDDQLNIALQKAGISPNGKYTIEKFKVIRHR